MQGTTKITKNLYDTEWGKYDFKKAVYDDPELQLGNYDQGKEGWQKNNDF